MSTDFETWFHQVTRFPPRPWQVRLAAPSRPGHRRIRIPTGFGKTLGVAGAWLFHRVERGDATWPTRLVWMLPMRTLVEQTVAQCQNLLKRWGRLRDPGGPLDQPGTVGVHVLMGGADAADWHLSPAEPAILVGTQDMLLSRAMNRGYGAARGRWPIDFGLLSQDTLWILDEIQLMGVGFSTALQLAAFRDASPALRASWTWAMSATLQADWFARSPDTGALCRSMEEIGLADEDREASLWTDSAKPLHRVAFDEGAANVGRLAARVLQAHGSLAKPKATTLVVCNTVKRARALFDAIDKAAPADVGRHLLHSRFRGVERRRWEGWLQDERAEQGSRILVATQVIEAGVDLSADLLFTEICPWSSLVQRLGRLARRGGVGEAHVLALDAKSAAPYEVEAIEAAWEALSLLAEGSPRSLEHLEAEHPERTTGLFPFEPGHLLLREELDELYDTTPDLSGGDLDISRYIREGQERDVSVAWIEVDHDARGRAVAPSPAVRPSTDALCAVPVHEAQDWLCGKGSKGADPPRLRPGVAAWVWDYLDGAWRLAERKDLRPGAQVLVDAKVGGYDPGRGFDASVRATVPVVGLIEAGAQERADAAQDQEDLSQAAWQTIGFHGGAVANQVEEACGQPRLIDEPLLELLKLAARWHDLGKAHPAFRGAIQGGPERADIAKAPAEVWSRGPCIYQVPGEPPDRRPGLRHELASALAMFDVLSRHAPPDHPSRLGHWATVLGGQAPRDPGPPSPLERELLDLSPDDFDLVVFLVCAHHGKVRARMHAAPADQRVAPRLGSLPIRGVFDGDSLPAVPLPARDGTEHWLPESRLSLEPAALGISTQTGRSWTERVDGLRARLGPFALAWLEAILRAADVRASRDAALVDPALSSFVSPRVS